MMEFLVRRFISLILPKSLAFKRHPGLKSRIAPETEERLKCAGAAFLEGLNASIRRTSIDTLHEDLKSDRLTDWERGFAFEGAAMGLGLLRAMLPWQFDWIPRFLEKCEGQYRHLIHVGAGWANAYLFWRRPCDLLAELDPLLGWLSVDGYGFCRGLWGHKIPASAGYTGRAMRQGYGRALWFLTRASVPVLKQVMEDVQKETPEWSDDLWSGIGLASVFAGRLPHDDLQALRTASGTSQCALAQGAAFAAKARLTANDSFCKPAQAEPSSEQAYLNLACRVLCGCDAGDAARMTDQALVDLPPDGAIPAYEEWRQRIQRSFRLPLVCGSSLNESTAL